MPVITCTYVIFEALNSLIGIPVCCENVSNNKYKLVSSNIGGPPSGLGGNPFNVIFV